MTFREFLTLADDRLLSNAEEVARYEYVWNSAIRAAATACQNRADRFGDHAHREGAVEAAEAVMDLWVNPLMLS